MNTGIFGKYGSGKSLLGAHLVERALLEDQRPIVTTLALNLRELNHYMQERHPGRDTRVHQRILLLDKEQMRRFWRYRGLVAWGEYGQEARVLGPVSAQGSKEKGTAEASDPAWESIQEGVHYIIDEAPVAFKAREWAKNGPECMDYLTQHRKLGDTCYFMARTVGMLDKQIRDSLDQCIILDNWYQRAIGLFVAPRKIKCYYFEDCPPQRGTPPARTEDIYIDAKALARCYYTAKGMGVAGTTADIGTKAKGLPWWTSIAGVVVGVLLFWFGIHYAMTGALSLSLKRRPPPPVLASSSPAVGQGLVVSAAGLIPHLFPESATNFSMAKGSAVYGKVEARNDVQTREPVEAGNYYGWGKSNGRMFLSTDSGLLEVHSLVVSNRWAIADGVVWRHVKQPKEPVEEGSRVDGRTDAYKVLRP